MNDSGEFAGKILFVTGAGAGFGRHMACAFAAAGAGVGITDVDPVAAEATAAGIRADGGRAVGLACDVASESAVEAAVAQTCDALGGIDLLVNNAGRHLMKYSRTFAALTTAEIRDLFDVNLMGAIHCVRACAPVMAMRGGGAIVNIASIAAHSPATPYGVSKLAVRGLTIAFATELAADNIRVNAISPGLMATESALSELPDEMWPRFQQERQLVHRRGEMADVTETALFLCSPRATFITGETIKVSGGYPLGV